MTDPVKIFEKISTNILTYLAHTLPVACASDEFYFFPHIASNETTGTDWDDFSPASVNRIINEISIAISEINGLKYPDTDSGIQIDKNMMIRFLTTLRDQLTEGVFWKKQPSFYLTLMNTGIAIAVSSGDHELICRRVEGLPEFLSQAIMNLEEVPYPWLETGLSMITDCRRLAGSLNESLPGMKGTIQMIDELENKLKRVNRENNFKIPDGFLEKIYKEHLATGMGIDRIMQILKDEADEMKEIMLKEASCLLPHHFRSSPGPEYVINRVYDTLIRKISMQEDLVIMYRNEVERIWEHLVKTGIISPNGKDQCPVHVRKMPAYFRAIRSASSYSIYPKYPPVEGIFYVLNDNDKDKLYTNIPEYRMLTAHETYPGHHLLDSSRLGLKSLILRSLEFPVFYEGWACFAEVLLDITGYFTEPADRFILAKRRFWRSVRGQVDILLQMGEINFEGAVSILHEAGMPTEHALASAKIYTLNPGYQVCYTVGIRKFLDLYKRHSRGDLCNFVKTILSGGEILFDDLEIRLGLE